MKTRTLPIVRLPFNTWSDPKRTTIQVPAALMTSTARADIASIRSFRMLSSRNSALSVPNRSASYRSRPNACTSETVDITSLIRDAIPSSFFRCLRARSFALR